MLRTRSKSFVQLLVVIAFMVLGLFYLISFVYNYISGAEIGSLDFVTAVVGLGLLVAGGEMYSMRRLGWVLGLVVVVIDAVIKLYEGIYLALVVDAVFVLLLLLVSKDYLGALFFSRKPEISVPPASKPLANIYLGRIEHKKNFVRRKR